MKKIILISIILILLVCVGIVVILGKNSVKKSESPEEAAKKRVMADNEEKCINSGGRVVTLSCCKNAGDFPNTCSPEICGCMSQDSQKIKVCECELERCFNGEECVMPQENNTQYVNPEDSI
jgi:hypothetical protein